MQRLRIPATNGSTWRPIEIIKPGQGQYLLRRYAPYLSIAVLLLSPIWGAGAEERAAPIPALPSAEPASPQQQALSAIAAYEGKIVESIQLPGVPERDRAHLLELLPQKAGQPLGRDQ